MNEDAWRDAAARTLVLRRAARAGRDVDVVLLLLNAGGGDVAFTLPSPRYEWQCALDSAEPAEAERRVDGDTVTLRARSAQVLTARLPFEEPAAA